MNSSASLICFLYLKLTGLLPFRTTEDDDFELFKIFVNELDQSDENQKSNLLLECGTNDPESSDSSSDVRRRCSKRGRNFIPRVPKNDIRRHYGTMLMNVLNTNFQEFVESFFETYSVPSFRTNILHVNPALYPHIPPHLFQNYAYRLSCDISLSGWDWLLFHRLFSQVLAPDQVYRIKSIRLVTRKKDRRSLIIMSTELELHQIYDFKLVDVMNSLFTFGDEASSETSVTFLDDRVPFAFHTPPIITPMMRGKAKAPKNCLPMLPPSFDYPMRLLDKPKRYLLKSQMVLAIDEFRRITSFDINDGRLPSDALAILEAKAAEWRIEQSKALSTPP